MMMKLRFFAAVIAAAAMMCSFTSKLKAISPLKPCPISLTNPDGQEMALEKYDLRIAIDGPLSLTEMEMVFRNPQPRRMEGRFLYLLPPGATISRFAKEVDGKLMEGEVVERLRAQAVYTEILQSMRDPALLEMDQGNRFSARVFPIPANGTVRLLLSYSQRVPVQAGERRVTVPLAGIPKIGEFNYSVVVNDLPGQQLQPVAGFDVNETTAAQHRVLQAAPKKDFTPQTDLTFAFKVDPSSPRLRAVHAGDFQMLSWRADDAAVDFKEPKREWCFYFDTSASNADMEKRRLEAIDQLVTKLNAVHQYVSSAYAFDVSVQPLPKLDRIHDHDPSPEMISGQRVDALRARHALGATNLEAALKHIGEQARAAEKPQRFVLVSDGIATLGARDVHDLLTALGDWPERHVLHALVLGAKQDERTLSAIVEKTHGRVVTLALNDDVEINVPNVIQQLTQPLGKTYEFYDEGAEWIYPKTFRDVQPGAELVVFSQLKKGATSKVGVATRGADGKLTDTQLAVQPTESPDFAPLLQRETYGAYLSQLEKAEDAETKPEKRAELHKTRIDISVKNRVLCPLTSLLVLENEWDYQRFGIDRTSLADVMVVGANGIELMKRVAETLGLEPMNGKKSAMGNRKADALKDAAAPLEKAGKEMEQSAQDEMGDDDKRPTQDGQRRQLVNAGTGGGPGRGGGWGSGGDPSGGGGMGGEELDALSAGDRAGGRFAEGRARPAPGLERLRRASSVNEASIDEGRVAQSTPASPPAPMAQAASPVTATLGLPADAPRVGGLEANGLRRTPLALPEWAKQGIAPTADQLQVLHAQVAANPRDRGLRNAYANALYRAKKWDELQGQAFEWLPFDPENPQVFEYLGKSAAGLHDPELALRAITSIAEIAPNRAALLARAGWLLLTAEKYDMAEQMFREALKNRKDDANIYRGLGLTLWLAGNFEKAAEELDAASKLTFNARYGDVHRVLREELAYVVRAWAAGDAAASGAFAQRTQMEPELQRTDALRATLCWETDANDVDLHVIDPSGEECFYSHMHNASGLELYSDQTQGLGPEVIRTAKAIPGKYYVGVNYFSAGPMGVSRGVVVVMKPDNGVVKRPEIVPFCLIPEGSDMRLITTLDF